MVNDVMHLFTSASEAVYWVTILDDQLKNRRGYKQFLSNHPAGPLLPGVRYIRNLKTHSLTMTIKNIPGRIYPITYPTAGSEIVWLPFADLPQPQKTNSHTPEQAAAYSELMADKPTRHTLDILDDGFASLAGLHDSPLADLVPDFPQHHTP